MVGMARIVLGMLSDFFKLGVLIMRPFSEIRAENLILRRQLAKYLERGIKPRRMDGATP